MTRNALVLLVHDSAPQYRQAGSAQLKIAHALKDRIRTYLDENVKKQIDLMRTEKKASEEDRHPIWLQSDLGEQTFDRAKTATIIRQWIWKTYQGRVGLDAYEKDAVTGWTIYITY